MALLGIGASIALLAVPDAPEIDPGSCASALALVGGALLVIRGRKKV
jgi:hypothetical protein